MLRAKLVCDVVRMHNLMYIESHTHTCIRVYVCVCVCSIEYRDEFIDIAKKSLNEIYVLYYEYDAYIGPLNIPK